MHVYSRMNLAERRCFYICRSQFPLGRAPLFFKMLILAVYLSILKRSVCSSILTGLVPCARECCKEEPGKPLGPYFQFLPDDLKGRVSDTDFTLHFWSAPALIYWWLSLRFGLSPERRNNIQQSWKTWASHLENSWFYFRQTSPVTQLGFIFEMWFYQSHKFSFWPDVGLGDAQVFG